MSGNKQLAQMLTDNLRNGLVMANKALAQIIEIKAWEELGYDSVLTYWQDEIAPYVDDVTPLVRTMLAYAAFEEGASEARIATIVHGMGPETVEALKFAHEHELTPQEGTDHAASWVRGHPRRAPGKRNAVHIRGLSDTELEYWKSFADKNKVKPSDLYRDALRLGMDMVIREGFKEAEVA